MRGALNLRDARSFEFARSFYNASWSSEFAGRNFYLRAGAFIDELLLLFASWRFISELELYLRAAAAIILRAAAAIIL